MILEFDKSLWKLWYVAVPWQKERKNQRLYNLKEFAEMTGADITVNVCAFNGDNTKARKLNAVGNTIQYMVASGIVSGYGDMSTDEHIEIDRNNVVSGYKYYTSGVPIIDDKIQLGLNASKNARCFHGIEKDGKYVVAQTDSRTGKMTEKAFAQDILNFCGPIKIMLSEDGGGSVGTYCRRTGCYSFGATEKWRPLANCLCIKYIGPDPERNIKQGVSGDDVKVLQAFLCHDMDGKFGPNDVKEYRSWQKRAGRMIDGCCGPSDREQLFKKWR